MKVLFVAANPLDTGRLALDEEMRAIERKVAGSPFASQMEFVAVWAARPDDLLQAVNEHAPAVIHFAGHASASTLELVGDDRRAQPVTHKAILRLIGLEAAASVRAVVLSACYSSELASAIEKNLGCAIGMTSRWGDEQAPLFSSSFYRAIGFGATIREAVEQGCTSILLEGLTGADDVRLHCDDERARTRLIEAPPSTVGRQPDPARRPTNAIPLFNESECADYVAELLKRSWGRATLTFIDVDGVLGINAVYGEHVGDLVIARCGEIVAEHADQFREALGACRVRGDQFLILTRDPVSPSAHDFSAKLIEKVQNHDWSELARDLHVSATGAIAYWERPGYWTHRKAEDPASLILRAILGVKEAKRKHKATLANAPLALPRIRRQLDPERPGRLSERDELTTMISQSLS